MSGAYQQAVVDRTTAQPAKMRLIVNQRIGGQEKEGAPAGSRAPRSAGAGGGGSAVLC